jgi:hypothetical protein
MANTSRNGNRKDSTPEYSIETAAGCDETPVLAELLDTLDKLLNNSVNMLSIIIFELALYLSIGALIDYGE